MSGLDSTLAALADPHRRRVVDILREGPRPAGELARETGMAAPAMSRALRALKDAGIVSDSHPPHDARLRIYELHPAPMRELREWLQETETLWAAQLEALRDHLERTR